MYVPPWTYGLINQVFFVLVQVGSANLITEAVKNNVSMFVMQSSSAVYGNATLPWAESTSPQPVEPYGTTNTAHVSLTAFLHMHIENSFKMNNLTHSLQTNPQRNRLAIQSLGAKLKWVLQPS